MSLCRCSKRHFGTNSGSKGIATPVKQAWKDKFSRILSLGNSSRRRDIERLVQNFTSPALASALRDREEILCECAKRLHAGETERLESLLKPFLNKDSIVNSPPVPSTLCNDVLELLRKRLSRMPRQISNNTSRRASVVLPLCEVNGLPSVLFTTRSEKVRRFKGEVCFPGGMADPTDKSIIEVGLRELAEETGVLGKETKVLGVLRCDWSELASITGVAVTPVVAYIGEISSERRLSVNSDEVANYFTVPLTELANPESWTFRQFSAPVFSTENHQKKSLGTKYGTKINKFEIHDENHHVWGLTGYVLSRFMQDVLFAPIDHKNEYT
eukprot:GSMAST32.ASY1.ANO1.1119.1 assembled CDS